MRKTNFLFMAALLFILAACEQKNIVVDKPPQIEGEAVYEETDYNLDMRDFAMAVSEAVNSNKTFLNLVRDEVNKKFDGDFNVLLTQIVDTKVTNYVHSEDGRMLTSGEISVRDLLNSSFGKAIEKANLQENNKISERFNSPGTNLIDKLTTKYPDLQIAVPVFPEHLNNDKYVPPVIFIPNEVDDDNYSNLLPGFKGNKDFFVHSKISPDSACIIINMNERMNIKDNRLYFIQPPTNVTGESNDLGIKIHWQYSNSATSLLDTYSGIGHRIYRKENNGQYVKIYENTSPFNRSYIDNNVKLNNTYYYYVVAYKNGQESAPAYCNNGAGITVIKRPSAAQKFSVNPEGLNKAVVRWTFADTDNNGKVNIYKRELGNPYAAPFFSANLPVSGDEHWDYNVPAGKQLEYRIDRTTNTSTSAPKYDVMYMPYRDVSKKSKVYIKGVKYDDVRAIESWWRGAPEYLIKGFRVKKDGTNLTAVEEFGTFIDCQKKYGGKNDTWEIVNRLVMSDWQPGFDGTTWYDVLSFYIVEKDNTGKEENVELLAQTLKKIYNDISKNKGNKSNIKTNALPWGAIISAGVELAVNIPKWIKSEDDRIGSVYLKYYEDPNSTFSISSIEKSGTFTIQFSDKP